VADSTTSSKPSWPRDRLGRVGEPDDVARAIAGLLSDDNRWVNAQSIEIAGGFMI
jgi:NAD(P)-dependent dehydrogenase (short-subunit alcohol dehydrogenase family)